MKRYIKLSLLFILAVVSATGCANDEEGQTNEEDTSNQETNETEEAEVNETEEKDTNEMQEEENGTSDDSNDSTDTRVDHQEGLTMGETGIVVDNSENSYEVTLNSVEYVDTVAGLDPNWETYVVANITVENIGDDSFNAEDMFQPGFGPEGQIERSLNQVYFDADADVEQDLLEGEIAPGESVTGDHIFEIAEIQDEYLFIIGGRGEQILTYANWDVLESEVE